jgi:hypothetical protein
MVQAVTNWSGIADKFPNDHRVLAELAELFSDEGQMTKTVRATEEQTGNMILIGVAPPLRLIVAQL